MSSVFTQSSENEAYQISPEFWSATEEIPVVEHSEPGENDLDELLVSKLGVRGWGRLHYFRSLYSEPWGEERKGKPLSPRAVEAFFRFLELIEFSTQGKAPSLFLTDEGHLELCWEDSQGGAIQIEFGPRDSEIYLESAGLEETMSNERIPEIARRLNVNQ